MDSDSEVWTPQGTTLMRPLRLMSVLDTVEGFRILVSTDDHYTYVVRAQVVFYRCSKVADNWPRNLSDPHHIENSLFLVENSTLVRELYRSLSFKKYFGGVLAHFALCVDPNTQIDFVTTGDYPLIRLAGSESIS